MNEEVYRATADGLAIFRSAPSVVTG